MFYWCLEARQGTGKNRRQKGLLTKDDVMKDLDGAFSSFKNERSWSR